MEPDTDISRDYSIVNATQTCEQCVCCLKWHDYTPGKSFGLYCLTCRMVKRLKGERV